MKKDHIPSLISSANSLSDLYLTVIQEYSERLLLEQASYENDDKSLEWLPTTYEGSLPFVYKVATFIKDILTENSIEEQVQIGICSNTRPEWILSDAAILMTGNVSVSIYTPLAIHGVKHVLSDSECKLVFVENQQQLDKVLAANKELNQLIKIIAFEEVEVNQEDQSLVCQLSSVLAREVEEGKSTEAIFELLKGYNSNNRQTIASIVYTSGSTGEPKGVVQCHGNHLANLDQIYGTGCFGPGGKIFLYLPLAHSFARLVGYIGLFTDTSLMLPSVHNKRQSILNLNKVTSEIKESNCEFIPSIPRLFEKAKALIQLKAKKENLLSYILASTLRNAQQVYEKNYSSKLQEKTAEFVFSMLRPIREKIKRQLFGDKFIHAISGGAKLDPNVNHFFQSLGITIHQGYGLTETCVATNVNLPTNSKIGSVGKVLSEIEVKIADDGEVMFKGDNISVGYYKRPEATENSWIEDGWFKTGDLGFLDDDGFLFITGRKKELIVTAGGKKVTPTKVESLVMASELFDRCIIVGDGMPYCVGLIKPNEEKLKELGITTITTIDNFPELVNALAEVNSQLGTFEQIKKASLIIEDFTIDNGLLTPTMKVKRVAIHEKYSNIIDSLYRKI